ncbi:MAG: hypothetical protein ACTSYI_17215 [Promethearchaeota archaeon]
MNRSSQSILLIGNVLLVLCISSLISVTPVSGVYLSHSTELEINPFVIGTPTEIGQGIEATFVQDVNDSIHFVSTEADLSHYYLYYSVFDSEFQLISREKIFQHGDKLLNPQIRVGSDGSTHIIVGVEEVGYYYLFTDPSEGNGTEWFQTYLSATPSLNSGVEFELDEWNKPHIVWFSRDIDQVVTYFYPKYTFTSWTETNTTYHNETLITNTSVDGVERTVEFGQEDFNVDLDLYVMSIGMVLQNSTRAQFVLHTKSLFPANHSNKSTHAFSFVSYQHNYVPDEVNSSSVVISNYTSPENYTTDVYEWSNTTYSYLNYTSGEFGDSTVFLNVSSNITLKSPQLHSGSGELLHLAWLQSEAQNPWSCESLALNTTFGVVSNQSFISSKFPLLPNIFVSDITPVGQFEALILANSTSGQTYLMKLKDGVYVAGSENGWSLEPISMITDLFYPNFDPSFAISSSAHLILQSSYDPFLVINYFSLHNSPSPYYSSAYNLSASIDFTPLNIPPRFNETIDSEYSPLRISDQRPIQVSMSVMPFYPQNSTCNLTFQLDPAFATLRGDSPTNYSVLELTSAPAQFSWVMDVTDDYSYETQIVIDIFAEGDFVDSVGFAVIIIPGIDFLSLGLYVVALFGFSSLFLYYKKIR